MTWLLATKTEHPRSTSRPDRHGSVADLRLPPDANEAVSQSALAPGWAGVDRGLAEVGCRTSGPPRSWCGVLLERYSGGRIVMAG